MRELEVDLGARRYTIRIGAGLLDTGTDWEKLLPGRHVLIVSDRNVAPSTSRASKRRWRARRSAR